MKKFSILNSPFSIQKGFTLVELLISLVVLATVTSTIAAVFFISLRSVKKINNLETIKQNGNYAITQMTKMLQYAELFDGVSNDNVTYTKVCQLPSSSSLTTYRYVRFTALDGGQTTFSCGGNPQTVASNSASLIDNTTYQMTACTFTCTQSASDNPYTIGVSFTIDKIVKTSFLDDPSSVIFQSSVTMRNAK